MMSQSLFITFSRTMADQRGQSRTQRIAYMFLDPAHCSQKSVVDLWWRRMPREMNAQNSVVTAHVQKMISKGVCVSVPLVAVPEDDT